MRGLRTMLLPLAAAAALTSCQETTFEPTIHVGALGGPPLTLRGTVRSALDGAPVNGAKVRLHAPGRPYEFPFTVVVTETTAGGSYLLRLPTSFPSRGDCLGLRLSVRAPGFDPEGDVAGVICTGTPQSFDFSLDPAGSGR